VAAVSRTSARHPVPGGIQGSRYPDLGAASTVEVACCHWPCSSSRQPDATLPGRYDSPRQLSPAADRTEVRLKVSGRPSRYWNPEVGETSGDSSLDLLVEASQLSDVADQRTSKEIFGLGARGMGRFVGLLCASLRTKYLNAGLLEIDAEHVTIHLCDPSSRGLAGDAVVLGEEGACDHVSAPAGVAANRVGMLSIRLSRAQTHGPHPAVEQQFNSLWSAKQLKGRFIEGDVATLALNRDLGLSSLIHHPLLEHLEGHAWQVIR
jgi:hypothetical protein